jgi:hypothetical protein
LVDGEEGGKSTPFEKFSSHAVALALGRDEDDVDTCRRLDEVVMDIETVGKEDGLTSAQMGGNAFFVNRRHISVGEIEHEDVACLRGVFSRYDLQSFGLSFGPGLATFVKADRDIDTAVSEIQGVGVALAAVADDGDALGLND